MTPSLVLLPTYNERENLPLVIERLSALAEVDTLVIDDASPDGTGRLADRLSARCAHLSVLHRRRKDGLGRAYLHGFREALARGYRRVVTMDADLSHAPEDVPRLLGALDHADVAVGSRHARGGGVEDWPLARRLLSRAASLYARTLLGLPASDVTSGFRAYRAEVLSEIDPESFLSRGFLFQVEVLRRILDLGGRRVVEVPILFRGRARGHSKLSVSVAVEGLRGVAALSLGRRRPAVRSAQGLASSGDLPRASVIVPSRPEIERPRVLSALGDLEYPAEKLDGILVRGREPSRERNEAARRTRGEYVLFLDDDSVPRPDLLLRYVRTLASRPGVAAAGGPALPAPAREGSFADAATLILSEPWAVGRSAARYAARGELRETDERELILCNLIVRRSALEAAGGFDERLYPNEENRLMEKLRRRGWKLLYDPGARVSRPPPESPREYLSAIFRYGRGRGRQLRCGISWVSAGRLAAAALIAGGVAATLAAGVAGGGVTLLLPLLYLFYVALVLGRLARRAGLRRALPAAPLIALTHGTYAAGVLRGVWGEVAAPPRSHLTLARIAPGRADEPRSRLAPESRAKGSTALLSRTQDVNQSRSAVTSTATTQTGARP